MIEKDHRQKTIGLANTVATTKYMVRKQQFLNHCKSVKKQQHMFFACLQPTLTEKCNSSPTSASLVLFNSTNATVDGAVVVVVVTLDVEKHGSDLYLICSSSFTQTSPGILRILKQQVKQCYYKHKLSFFEHPYCRNLTLSSCINAINKEPTPVTMQTP